MPACGGGGAQNTAVCVCTSEDGALLWARTPPAGKPLPNPWARTLPAALLCISVLAPNAGIPRSKCVAPYAPNRFALGLVFAVTDKYFSKQAPSAPALGLASFNVNPTARRFALTGTISFNEWLFTIPSLPEGSPAPDLHFTFNMAAQSCDRNAQAPGGTANPSRCVSGWGSGEPGGTGRLGVNQRNSACARGRHKSGCVRYVV